MNLLSRILGLSADKVESVNEIAWIDALFTGQAQGVMVDVGAHFGESFRSFASRGWRVLVFEPDSDPRKIAAIRSQLNTQSKLYECALSDTCAAAQMFYRSGVSTGISGLIPFHQSHEEAKVVEVDTLKAVLLREGIDRVDFLKIDTEGNDLLVLKGLDWHVKPDVILCEFEDAKTKLVGYDYRELGQYLVAAGYQVFMSEWYPIVRYGVQHRWRALRKYPCDIHEPAAWGNFIAVSDHLVASWLASLKSLGITPAN